MRQLLGAILLSCLLVSLFVGCDTETDPPIKEDPDSTLHRIDFEFRVWNLRPLRDGEYYSLWVKQRPETAWRLASDTNFNRFALRDSTSIFGRFQSPHRSDSIYEMMVTIELTKRPTIPGTPFLKGSVIRDTGYFSMAHLGDFSKTQGGLTFTSLSADTAAFKKEFYLMKLEGNTPQQALKNLPRLHSGWRYGIWSADYEFFPYQEFLYGLFDDSVGHDSEPEDDAFPFPGGAKKQRLDLPSGRIIVTLEPPLYGDSLRYKGAELLYVLQLNRFVGIEKDKFYVMPNVSGDWLPYGRITFLTRQ
jgi:hypothetical protein